MMNFLTIPAGPRAFAIYGLGLAAALVLAMGATKGLVVVIGITILCVTFAHPMAGLVVAIFANTSLQVLGSSHIIGTPASLSKIFGAVTLGALFLHMIFARWRITASPIYGPIFGFFLIVFLWDFMIRNPETGAFEGTIRLIMMLLLATTVATFAGQQQKTLDQAVLALCAAIGLTGIIGLAEHFLPSLALASDDPRIAQGTIGAVVDTESLSGVAIKRITGGIGDANWLAYTLAMAVPLLIYLWHRYEAFWMRVVVLGLGGLMLVALVLSYTRTGFLGLGVAFLYLLIRGVVPMKPFLSLLMAGLAASLIYLPPGFTDRMFSAEYRQEGSTPIRMLFWTQATEIWLDKPVFGYGYKGFGINFYNRVLENLPENYRLQAWAEDMERSVIEGRELVSNIGAHNLQLEILVEYGIYGAVFYFLIFVVAIREMRRVEQRGPPHLRILAICVTASLLAFLACGLLGHSKYLKFLWLMLGLAMALSRIAHVGDSPTRSLFQERTER